MEFGHVRRWSKDAPIIEISISEGLKRGHGKVDLQDDISEWRRNIFVDCHMRYSQVHETDFITFGNKGYCLYVLYASYFWPFLIYSRTTYTVTNKSYFFFCYWLVHIHIWSLVIFTTNQSTKSYVVSHISSD